MNQSPLCFDTTFLKLPEQFYTRQSPTAVLSPKLILSNATLARQLNIPTDWLSSVEALNAFSGNKLLAGSTPIATVYAGHQFGHWNPHLGDGRAVLLGEVIDTNGLRYDIQLKGSGQTPYSRMGDGRSPLGPVLREYIVSEAMASLGIPSTRSLAAVTTGEPVIRNEILPGAILTRVARSHIRIGHFQYFSAQDDTQAVRLLADHIIQRDFIDVQNADNPYLDLLKQVISRQAQLIAKWQLAGFIHGVMNTDNMLLCGETIDYGPCAFMDNYDPNACFSSIDHGKRYAYKNQPGIAQWNLSWLAQSLLPLIDTDPAQAIAIAQPVLDDFTQQYQSAYDKGMHQKLGLVTVSTESEQVIEKLLKLTAEHNLDFTLTFRQLADLANPKNTEMPPVNYSLPDLFEPLLKRWRQLCQAENSTPKQQQATMYAVNPAFIPRNHLIEEAIQAAEKNNDFEPFHHLVDVLKNPFEYDLKNEKFSKPPEPEQIVRQTFCGT